MSIALLFTDVENPGANRIVPVATEEVFRTRWLPGAMLLELHWLSRMATGFEVTEANRGELLAELLRLRDWMSGALGADAYELERLDRLVAELRDARLGRPLSLFLG